MNRSLNPSKTAAWLDAAGDEVTIARAARLSNFNPGELSQPPFSRRATPPMLRSGVATWQSPHVLDTSSRALRHEARAHVRLVNAFTTSALLAGQGTVRVAGSLANLSAATQRSVLEFAHCCVRATCLRYPGYLLAACVFRKHAISALKHSVSVSIRRYLVQEGESLDRSCSNVSGPVANSHHIYPECHEKVFTLLVSPQLNIMQHQIAALDLSTLEKSKRRGCKSTEASWVVHSVIRVSILTQYAEHV